jgi:tetratricopeptide (TPR) repeat protein
MKVSNEDYEDYLHLERALRERGAGATTLEQASDRLAVLVRRAPAFLDAWLLAASLARYRFTTEHDGAQLAEAAMSAETARRLAPEDPRPLETLLRVALAADSLDRARALVKELQRLAPGHEGIPLLEAAIAEQGGDIDRAVALLREAVERRTSRHHLALLANLEYRIGRFSDARRDFERILERYPNDQLPRAKLAQLELLYGRPERAQSLFIELTERFPETGSYRTNLGLARMLLGNYAGAAADLRIAHGQRPKNIAVLLNLADCEELAGNQEVARNMYRRTLSLIDESPAASKWDNRLRAAQCLVKIGRIEEALVAARAGLASATENSEALYMASLVYVLAARRDSALTLAGRAVAKGMDARWFSFRWFDPLKADPGFSRALTVSARAEDPARTRGKGGPSTGR